MVMMTSFMDTLKVAKKSLIATMSELYAMTLIVICLAFTSTEIITEKVPLDYFESWGFYTYLYRYTVKIYRVTIGIL